jgi:hypothetical protein
VAWTSYLSAEAKPHLIYAAVFTEVLVFPCVRKKGMTSYDAADIHFDASKNIYTK